MKNTTFEVTKQFTDCITKTTLKGLVTYNSINEEYTTELTEVTIDTEKDTIVSYCMIPVNKYDKDIETELPKAIFEYYEKELNDEIDFDDLKEEEECY